MPNLTEYAAKGRIVSSDNQQVVFQPRDTVYQLRLCTQSPVVVEALGNRGMIHIAARKVYTIPSGGNFVSPITGTPRIVQGRVKYLHNKTMVVHAGVSVVVDLPQEPSGFGLVRGPLAVGQLVNVVALPGASFSISQ